MYQQRGQVPIIVTAAASTSSSNRSKLGSCIRSSIHQAAAGTQKKQQLLHQSTRSGVGGSSERERAMRPTDAGAGTPRRHRDVVPRGNSRVDRKEEYGSRCLRAVGAVGDTVGWTVGWAVGDAVGWAVGDTVGGAVE